MRLLLAGAGHAHLHLLRHAPTLAAAGMDVSLVAPATFRYSGVATAAASGETRPDMGAVDVQALTASNGVTHVPGRLRDLDLGQRVARTENGRMLGFDLLSLNVGSVPVEDGLEVGPGVVRIKPLDEYLALRSRLDHLADAGPARVAVVGSGASGLEVAGHVAARLAPGSQVVVVERDWVPAGFLPPGVFAAGDCAHFTPRPLPNLGVHGVPQGPVLLQALTARALGTALPGYAPPKHVLQILDLGGGVGLAMWGRWWSCGRAAHRVKHVIDQRWLRRQRQPPATT